MLLPFLLTILEIVSFLPTFFTISATRAIASFLDLSFLAVAFGGWFISSWADLCAVQGTRIHPG